jgi:hypothetical protein
MNFKSLVFIAGAVALASASSFQESTQELAQAECHPGYSRCTRCFGAAKKRANRYKAIVNWRNSQNRANSKWYHRQLATRNRQYKYYSATWYAAQLKMYRARQRVIANRVRSWTAQTNRYYANCQ